MPKRWFRRIGATVDRLNAHLPHQPRDVQPPGLKPFCFQKPLQHSTSGEGIVEMQFVNPAHQDEIAGRHRVGANNRRGYD